MGRRFVSDRFKVSGGIPSRWVRLSCCQKPMHAGCFLKIVRDYRSDDGRTVRCPYCRADAPAYDSPVEGGGVTSRQIADLGDRNIFCIDCNDDIAPGILCDMCSNVWCYGCLVRLDC